MAVLLSEDVPAYAEVSRALQDRLGAAATLYDLKGRMAEVPAVVAQIQASAPADVVAIGLLAAQASRGLSDRKVVFCQVFNFQEDDLVTPTRRGIQVLPPPERQFRIWKEISPQLRRVGVITGDGHRSLIEAARQAAAQCGWELTVRVVSSDKEAEYEFRRLLPRIEGLWLLPDNRVLSREVLHQIMFYCRTYRKQVLVNNHQLLAMGGLLSISARSDEVAEAALALLEKSRNSHELEGPSLMPLAGFDLRINGALAQELGLTVPPAYRDRLQPTVSR